MSTGQRIAQKRKENGLSQEALGEQLGVSRQSISKWESDAAMPEIEKLVAMSRLFSVSVGWLLAVEESGDEEKETGGELTAEQLRLVEEIVGRYIDTQPKPVKKKRRLVKFLAVAGCIALVVCLVNLFNKLDRLDSQYNNLQNSVGNISSGVDRQIWSITERVEAVLKAQNDLTADYGVSRADTDIAAGTVSFSAYAVPKTYEQDMTALFLAECGGRVLEFPGQLGEGQRFSAELTVPLVDSISISVVFLTGEVKETQLLDNFSGLYSRTIPECYAEDTFQFDDCTWDGSILTIPAGSTFIRPHSQSYAYDEDGMIVTAGVASIRVGIFKNRELITWLEQVERPAGYHGFSADTIFLEYGEYRIPFTEEDVLQLATVVTDEYGRVTVRGGEVFRLQPPPGEAPAGTLELDGAGEFGYYTYDTLEDWGL